ncbi:MAG: alpha-amylase family glycosyl hydrolase [Flavobacteriaceae bacterium]|nr:alpha-amylase family glycosyl hydrolase [Flavobacteriaceae bacterium]
MKKYLYFLLSLSLLSCQQSVTNIEVQSLTPITNQDIAQGVLYEVNLRQFTNEGTFNAFAEELPKVKALGVNILWFMPTFPISTTKSKGPLGSYYAVSDYKAVNPEYGSLEDLKSLVNQAHALGMYVIFDWVPGHTGWDHVWIKDHPEFYLKNEAGEIIDPIDPRTGESFGWTDVADLDYENEAMRAAMKEAMLYWIEEVDIDGYRVDQAYAVPMDFYEDTFAAMRAIKPVFLLGETDANHPGGFEHLKNFDASYDFPGHHLTKEIAHGQNTVIDYQAHRENFINKHDPSHFLLNFVSSHDENAWAGTVNEIYGEASHAMMALNYMAPGLPFLYGGVEYDLNKRLLFFEKDSFPRVAGDTYQLLKQLGELKQRHPSLNAGIDGGKYSPIETSLNEKVLAFERTKAGDTIVFMANMSKDHIGFTSPYNGYFKRYQDNKSKRLSYSYEYRMKPWEFWILKK